MWQISIPIFTTIYMLSKRIKKYHAYELKDVHEQILTNKIDLFTPKFVNSSIYDEKINHRLVITKSFYVFHKNYSPIDQIKYKYPHENITVYLTPEQSKSFNIKPKYDVIL